MHSVIHARVRSVLPRRPPAGLELRPLVEALRDWGGRWAFDNPRPDELDPAWLLTSLIGRRRPDALPPRRVVVEFRFRGGRRPYVWLVFDWPSLPSPARTAKGAAPPALTRR